MNTLNNKEQFKNMNELSSELKETLTTFRKECFNYLNKITNENYEKNEQIDIDEQINQSETLRDKLDEMEQRRRLVILKASETIEKMKDLSIIIREIIELCEGDASSIETRIEMIVKFCLECQEKKKELLIKKKQEELNDIRREYQLRIDELSFFLKEKQEKANEAFKILNSDDIKQLETWSESHISQIVFDSDVDDWSEESSVFENKILNKSKMVILIEDLDSNIFGVYISSCIDKTRSDISDKNAFVFSLRSNGRLNSKMKFPIKNKDCAFWLGNGCLFAVGYTGGGNSDIKVFHHKIEGSFCKQNSYNYGKYHNCLCGNEYPSRFKPKRILVIQMVQ